MRLLLVEDDIMIAESVLEALRGLGHAVDWARDGREGELALGNDVYDLVLLDLGLPKQDGLAVLIMTAQDAVTDRISGLDAGADDYLVKPFDLNELAARVRALLRRRVGQSRPVFVHGALTLNEVSHEVTVRGAPVTLVAREFSLLRALMEEPGKVYSKAELEEKLYGWNEEVESNTIEVHIHNLRKKLGAEQIVTVRGIGYRLASTA
ncbi:winged helix-turn-helix domain-containing protein [Paraburkholderia kirstenboschensis]|uniref:Winged helix-turn-helix domain-containing protein n=1 Tax=Paraburkholderia kirstenboschensis TaxID=1245436 RepID=A0ABZ0EAF1_9BURK|nr:winged helix-turn-helix domain-containing protein [Paraburkholderia kirstenboschensis]WOD14187.1 winged helix-turn-helix domain-containing protein [Paraburkholderia kirstenboschensis]